MELQLAYLKSVIEGVPGIEPWKAWFERNDTDLQRGLGRTKYLDLKIFRIKAIPRILRARGIGFVRSNRYANVCEQCWGEIRRETYGNGGRSWCVRGCFDVDWEE